MLYIFKNSSTRRFMRLFNSRCLFFLFSILLITQLAPASAKKDLVKAAAAPVIKNVSPDVANLEGGIEILILGENFTPDSLVVFGDSVIKDFVVFSSTEIHLRVPPQMAPGNRTIS